MSIWMLLCVGVAQAAPLFEWDPVVDTAVSVATGATWAAMYYGVEPYTAPSPVTGAPPAGVDAVALGRWDATLATTSDVTLYGAIPVAVGLSAWRAHAAGGRGVVATQLVVQSWCVSGATVAVIKHAVDRPRPFTWSTDLPPDAQEKAKESDATLSFPSGHTAFMGALAWSTAEVLVVTGDVRPWAARGAAAGLTLGMGALRVGAGRHYPSDVLAGGAIGAAVGASVVALHRADRAVALSGGPGGVAVSGRW